MLGREMPGVLVGSQSMGTKGASEGLAQEDISLAHRSEEQEASADARSASMLGRSVRRGPW
jgi:hypothetical protein